MGLGARQANVTFCLRAIKNSNHNDKMARSLLPSSRLIGKPKQHSMSLRDSILVLYSATVVYLNVPKLAALRNYTPCRQRYINPPLLSYSYADYISRHF